MLVGGRPFNGSTSLLNAYERLTLLAGYTEFRPIPSFEFDFIERLLLIFFKRNICCHISGSYLTYLAGVTNSFRGVSMYLALRDAPLLNLIFQRGGNLDTFPLEEFRFVLIRAHSEFDIDTIVFRAASSAFTYSVLESMPLEFAGPAPMSISFISCGTISRDSLLGNTL
jgi:hypothetical protein